MTTWSTPAASIIGTTRSMVMGSGSCGRVPATQGRSGEFAFHMWICESTMMRRACAGAPRTAGMAKPNPVASVRSRRARRVGMDAFLPRALYIVGGA